MDILLPILIAIITLGLGRLGASVTTRSPHWVEVHRKAILRWFSVGSFIGVALTGWLAVIGHNSGEDAKRSLLGDSERPPWVGVISMPGFTRFVITNNSDFPAYINGIDVDENSTNPSKEVRHYNVQELAAHTAIADNIPWIPSAENRHRRFSVEIATRAGLFHEDLILDLDRNNQWARAARVMHGSRTLEEDVDSAWPRDKDGAVDWGRR
jgi:hypothetical protein